MRRRIDHAPLPEISGRLRAARKARGLTLERLARESGVSKSMLSQIERGQANPTLATLWALTRSLDIEIQDLLRETAPPARAKAVIERLDAHFTPTIKSPDGKCTLRILSPLETATRVEWYELRAEPGAELRSDPHASGTIEHLTVIAGALMVESDGERTAVEEGQTVRYAADRPHAILNAGNAPATAVLVVTARL